MTKLRRSIVLSLLFLALIFSLEYLNLGGDPALHIHALLYPFIVTSMVVMLAYPAMQKLPAILGISLWVSLFLVTSLLLYKEPLFEGARVFLTVTEAALLTTAYFVAREVGIQIGAVNNTIENVTFGPLDQRVIKMEEAIPAIKNELLRARRHSRPLTAMVLEPSKLIPSNEDRTIRQLQEAMVQRYLFVSLAKIINQEARRTDLIVEQDKHGRFIILCPETQTDGTLNLAGRIQQVAKESLGIDLMYGIANFPDEAVTMEELLRKAEFNMLGSSFPIPSRSSPYETQERPLFRDKGSRH